MRKNKVMKSLCGWGLGLLLLLAPAVQANISGSVFRDFNANGVFDMGGSFAEVGMAGVTVKAFDTTGVEKASVVSGADGAYALTGLTSGADYRVEFSWPQTWLHPGVGASGTSVQFVKDGSTTTHLALSNAEDTPSTMPYLAVPHYINGNPSAAGMENQPGLYVLPYDAVSVDSTTQTPAPIVKATMAQLGATWGTAYQRSSKTLYTSAVLRRFVGLGPLGTGGIYKVDMSDPSAASSGSLNYLDVQSLGIITGTDPREATGCNSLANTINEPAHDIAAANQFGKSGIGGMAMDNDHERLWLVNLSDRKLYGIQHVSPTTTPVAADVLGGYAINLPAGYACQSGELRPWAVKYHQGNVYVGVLCDASATYPGTNELQGLVLRFDPANAVAGFAVEHTFGLAKPRAGYGSDVFPWGGWNQYLDRAPLLTGIEFDVDGSLMVGIMDTMTMRVGNRNYNSLSCSDETLTETTGAGDVLRFCKSSSGYLEDGTAGCSTSIPAAVRTHDEYYWGDYGPLKDSKANFNEATSGGLAFLAGTGQLVSNGFDPAGFHQNGLYWLDNNTGADAKRYSIYTTEPNTTFPTATMGKTAGLGDLELVVDAAPIEVGNRVWLDADGDGIQDAGEVGIDGVAVQLVCGSDEATTTTANGGQFLFSNAQGGHAPFMQAAKTCTIRVNSTQAPVKDDSLTLQNADGMTDNNPQTDLRDSDAIDKAGVAEIQFTVGNAGDNNHTLDIGYKSQLVNPVTIIPPIDTCPALDYSYVVAKAAAGDPLIVGGTSSESKSLMVFPKSATGSLPLGTGTALEKYAENWQVGTVWGLAVQGSEKKVFSSAMLKRHAGLGPNGLGAIYVSDLNSGSGTAPMTTSKFVDLVADFGIDVGQAQVPDNAGRGLPAKTGSPSLDNAVFPLIGTVGLGDLDIDESGSHLFVVNLFDKKIYKINIAQGISDAPVAYSIPATNGAAGTTMRPWGLEIAGGKLYAGVVYTPSGAGVASDLSAAIYQMDLASGVWEATPVIPFALNYPRGLADDSTSGNWRPWEDDYSQWLNTSGEVSINPQPVLADMELDSEGAFHIAFIDRASHQVGNSNLKPDGSGDMTSGVSAGDLLRTWNDGGVIRLESKGIAGGYTSSGTGVDVKGAGGSNANQGPDGGEFYWADNFSEGHSETMFGGLALHLLDKRLAATVMNPLDGRTNAGGMRILDTDNGAPLQNYEVYAKDFGKAAGLGDLELVCEKLTPAVHSIGNRVWIDANNNGVADIGESAVSAGVKLDLKNASGGVLNTTTTDVNGRYLFSGLDAGSYQVCVSADNFAASAVLAYYTASTGKTPVPKADTDNTDGDDNGSDDTANGLCSDLVTLGTDEPTGEMSVTGNDGADGQGTPDTHSNLTVDFGVVPPMVVKKADLSLTKTANPTSVKRGDKVIYTLTVGNAGQDDATGVKVKESLPAGVTWVSDDGLGTYDNVSGIWTVGDINKDTSKVLNITVTVN